MPDEEVSRPATVRFTQAGVEELSLDNPYLECEHVGFPRDGWVYLRWEGPEGEDVTEEVREWTIVAIEWRFNRVLEEAA